MRRPAEPLADRSRPPCCPEPWSPHSPEMISLGASAGFAAELAAACEHTLEALDKREDHWDRMRRAAGRGPTPLRLALDLEGERRGRKRDRRVRLP